MNEFLNASGKDEVVGTDHLAVRRFRRDQPKANIVILHHADELAIGMNPDPRIFLGILESNSQRLIRAGVADDYVFEIVMRLIQYTLDALCQIVFPVVDRSDHAYQRLSSWVHSHAL
jgi:hypothetical protein